MEKLIIEADIDIPAMVLDKEANCFEISGKSLPEDVVKTYLPVLNWIDQYVKDPLDETVFVFKLNYLNTASTKAMTQIVHRLKTLIDNGKKLKVNWYYELDDFDMKKLGSDISFFTGVPFDFFEMEE